MITQKPFIHQYIKDRVYSLLLEIHLLSVEYFAAMKRSQIMSLQPDSILLHMQQHCRSRADCLDTANIDIDMTFLQS